MGIAKSKECFKCKEIKPLSDFYKHKMMADGHLGKCKECNKKDVIENRLARVEYYRDYDRKRGNRQTKEHRDEKRRTEPVAHKARNMVSNYIRDKKLFRMPCEKCGREDNVHAHHDDYAKPLNVRWLCVAHHGQWHKKYGEGLNKC